MRILGIDPGSRATGFGFVEVKADKVTCLAQGVIRTGSGEFPERLGVIFTSIRELLRQHKPDQVAVESVFISRNPASALKLGQARGAAISAVISEGLSVAEYSPRSVKQALVGRGGADKAQVQHMVGVLLQLRESLQEDAADALAVALCHHHTSETLTRMNRLQGR